MATIDDLQKSISQMSESELHQRLIDIRSKRRAPKAPQHAKKTAAQKSNNLVLEVQNMTPEQIQELMTRLAGSED